MSQAPNGIQQPDVVARIYHIPLIEESVNKLVGLVKAHGLTAFFYTKGESIALRLLDASKPIQDRLPLAAINGYCNGYLDLVQSKFPRAFEIHADELFATARKPADQAYELFQQRVAGAQKALGGVQDRLSNLTEAIPRSQEEGQKMLMGVFNEMNKVKDNMTASAKEMPSNVQTTVQPLLDDLQAGLNEVSKELNNKDLPLNERAQRAAKYIKDHALPAFEKARDAIVEKKNQQPQSYSEAAAPN